MAHSERSAGSVSKAIKTLKTGVLGCLFIMSKAHNTIPPWKTGAAVCVRFLQLFAFVISKELGRSWPSVMGPLQVLSGAIQSTLVYKILNVEAFFSLFYFVFAFVILLVLLLLYGVVGFTRNHFPSLFPLKVLRVMGGLAAGVLFIPLMEMLMYSFKCNASSSYFWREGDFDCAESSMTALRACAGILVALLLLFSVLFASSLYDHNSLSGNSAARAHGRADVIMILMKFTLVLVANTFVKQIEKGVVIAVASLCGCVWVGMWSFAGDETIRWGGLFNKYDLAGTFFYFMPFFAHWVNKANMSAGMVYTWGMVCLVLNNYYPSTDASITFFVGVPFAVMTAFHLADWRVQRILKSAPNRLRDPYEVELRGRYLLHTAAWGHPTASLRQQGHISARVDVSTDQGISMRPKSDHKKEILGHAELVQGEAGLDERTVLNVRELYREAVNRFPRSAILHVFCARFYSTYMADKHMTYSHILQADKRHPSMDIAYLVFQARKLAEDNTGSEGMSAINRVSFEKHSTDARKYVQLAAQKQLQFWTELMEPIPDLTALDSLAAQTNDSVSAADAAFTNAFAINPQSLIMMRLFAAFNLHVLCNPDKASVLTAEADRIEDQKAKERNSEGSKMLQFFEESAMDVSTDSTAMITMDATAANIGIILSVNAATCKLFGYSRLQLERRSAFTLLPAPLDAWHQSAVKTYCTTGEGTVVDYTRVVFVLHKSGYIVPVLSNVRDAPGDEGSQTYLWLLREMRSSYHYMMLDEQGFILGLSSGSVALLSVDPATITSNRLHISNYIYEWEKPSIQKAMEHLPGALLRVEAFEEGSSSPLPLSAHQDTMPPSPTITANSGVRTSTWVHGVLQSYTVDDKPVRVLQWKILSAPEQHLIATAEARRAALLGIDLPVASSSLKIIVSPQIGHQAVETVPSMSSSASVNAPIPVSGDLRVITKAESPFESTRDPTMRIKSARLNTGSVAKPSVEDTSILPGTPCRVSIGEDDQLSEDLSQPVKYHHSRTGIAIARSAASTPLVQNSEQIGLLAVRRPSTSQRDFPGGEGSSYFVSGGVTPDPAMAAQWQQYNSQARSGGRRFSQTMSGQREGSVKNDDGTVQSKGSTASKTISRLRRYLMTSDQKLLPGLWWLRSVGVALLLVSIGLAVVVTIITRVNFRKMDNNISYIYLGAARMGAKADILYSYQELLYHARNWIPLSNASIDIRRAYMVGNTTKFSQIHREMIELAQEDEFAHATYVARYISMRDFSKELNSPFGAQVIRNLIEVGTFFANQMLTLANYPVERFGSLKDPAIDTIKYLFTRFGNGHETLQNSMDLGFTITNRVKDSIYVTQTVVFAIMVVVVGVIGVAVFFPILRGIDKSSDQLMLQFVQLPATVRSSIFEDSVERLKTLKREYGDDGGGESDSESDDEDREAMPSMTHDDIGMSPIPDRFPKPVGSDGVDRKQHVAVNINSTHDKATIFAQKRAYKKSLLATVALHTRFICPLILLLLFFLTIYLASTVTLNEVTTLTAISAASAKRAQCARHSLVELRRLETLVTDWRYRRNAFWATKQSVDCVLYHNTLLAYGDESGTKTEPYTPFVGPVEGSGMGILPDTVSSIVRQAAFGDVCTFLAENYDEVKTDVARCHAFGGGVLKGGLVAAADVRIDNMLMHFIQQQNFNLLQFWRGLALDMAERQIRRGLLADKLSVGRGYIVNALGFNYSQYDCIRSDGCILDGNYGMPSDGSILPPTVLPDFTYTGDYPANSTEPNSSVPYYIGDELLDPRMSLLLEADALFLTPALFALTKIYIAQAHQKVARFYTLLNTFVPVYITVMGMVMLFVFLPQVARANKDIQGKRSMLLYLPLDVVSRYKSIKMLVNDILGRNDTATGTVSAAPANSA